MLNPAWSHPDPVLALPDPTCQRRIDPRSQKYFEGQRSKTLEWVEGNDGQSWTSLSRTEWSDACIGDDSSSSQLMWTLYGCKLSYQGNAMNAKSWSVGPKCYQNWDGSLNRRSNICGVGLRAMKPEPVPTSSWGRLLSTFCLQTQVRCLWLVEIELNQWC